MVEQTILLQYNVFDMQDLQDFNIQTHQKYNLLFLKMHAVNFYTTGNNTVL